MPNPHERPSTSLANPQQLWLSVLLPTIVAFYVQNFVYVPSLSSPLLLRNYPNTFAFIPIPPMSLSSWNRSNSKAFRHIMPCVAPVCEGMHYHKTGVPWQMKSIFIIILVLLVLPQNVLFCKGFWDSCRFLWNYRLWLIGAEPCKLLLPVSSQLGKKGNFLLLRIFLFFLQLLKYFIPFFLITPLIIF